MKSFDLTKYIDIALRRKYWIIIPFLLVILAGLSYYLTAPKIFEAQTLILVQEQKVPQEYVRAIVSSDLQDRLKTITQQVTSRTNLESIINDYQLYSDSYGQDMVLEQKVEAFRKNIKIDVARGGRGGNAFSIAFQGTDPQKVMQVTNVLASNFISENLKIRESQAQGTSSFLADELASTEKKLVEKETELKDYRQKYMGGMPEQINANLSLLQRSQEELDQLRLRLSDAQNRKIMIQQQMKQNELLSTQTTGALDMNALVEYDDSGTGGATGSAELAVLKENLKKLRLKYTDNHPEVRSLKSIIAKLEEQLKESEKEEEQKSSEDEKGGVAAITEPSFSGIDLIKPQLDQIDTEIREINEEINRAKAKVEIYNTRVEDTPKREQEILSITRDYDNLKKLYETILNRKLEAEMAVSMEKKQKGEQFRVIDPAKVPQRPVSPDSKKILLLTLLLGLALGGGLAYLVELMDTSYKTPEEVEDELQLPILVNMPISYTERELKHKRNMTRLAISSIITSFVIMVLAIVFAFKGFDWTINHLRGLL